MAKKGEAIRPELRTPAARQQLCILLHRAKRSGELPLWRRCKAVLGYIDGKSVITMCGELDVVRASINRWLRWYDVEGLEGLLDRERPGPAPRLSLEQLEKLVCIIEAGPQAASYQTGMWTGPMIGDVIHREFGVRYHNQHIPRLLHQLGFSVQRPRKRLARADAERQAVWIRTTLPAIKKKLPRVVALSCSATKPASGSTERSIEPGLV